MLAAYYEKLPKSYQKFKTLVNQLFPYIYDTKVIASNDLINNVKYSPIYSILKQQVLDNDDDENTLNRRDFLKITYQVFMKNVKKKYNFLMNIKIKLNHH